LENVSSVKKFPFTNAKIWHEKLILGKFRGKI